MINIPVGLVRVLVDAPLKAAKIDAVKRGTGFRLYCFSGVLEEQRQAVPYDVASDSYLGPE